ncbi:MAG: MBL fold metallo-hydrolase [Bryobacterales bacterium]|nr:MBL fold metallo-hydrolase [Bryobacterales bacterium]
MASSAEIEIEVVVLGSGTSVGVPMIGCHCPVCNSADTRDHRLRPSLLIRFGGFEVLVDTGPDLRQQALRAGMRRLDAVFYTHSHADHILGVDDIRPFNFISRQSIPIYGSPETLDCIRRTFSYAFDGKPSQSSRPKLEPQLLDGKPIDVHGLHFQPIPVVHGNLACHGFRFGNIAYLTDFSSIPENSLCMLRNLDIVFLDALRHKPHPMHSTVEESLRLVELLHPRQAYFTHISHDLPHSSTEETLPPHVHLAYDGLTLRSPWKLAGAEGAG